MNYEAVNNNIASWDSREHNPNPNMVNYLDQQNKINDRVSYSDSIQEFDQGYNNNNTLPNNTCQNDMQNTHYTNTGTLTKVLRPNGNLNESAVDDFNNESEYAPMSPKMKPFIPVTTSTLRQLTEVNQGTIKRSPKIYKKSRISPRKEPSSHLPLPPEPCDGDEVIEVSVDADLPPPPSAEDLKALSAPGPGRRASGTRTMGVVSSSPIHARTASVGNSPRHSVASSPRHSLTGVPILPGANGESPRHSQTSDVSVLPGGSPRHSLTSNSPRNSQNMGFHGEDRQQSVGSVHAHPSVYPNSHSVPASPARSLSVAGAPPPPPLNTPGKGHRRTSSVGSGGPPPPTKPKPPPPPKRSDNTHLVSESRVAEKVVPAVPIKPTPPKPPALPSSKPSIPAGKPITPPTPAAKPPLPKPGHGQSTCHRPPSQQQPTPQTTDFFSDLQRVLQQKQGYATLRKQDKPDPAESFPPPPPPQILPSSGSCHSIRGDIDDLPLPPPPAELLEGLRKIQNTKKKPPPPPPKRSSETRLTKHK